MGNGWKMVGGNFRDTPIFVGNPTFLRKVMGHAWKIDGETAENISIFVGKYHGKDSILEIHMIIQETGIFWIMMRIDGCLVKFLLLPE